MPDIPALGWLRQGECRMVPQAGLGCSGKPCLTRRSRGLKRKLGCKCTHEDLCSYPQHSLESWGVAEHTCIQALGGKEEAFLRRDSVVGRGV